MSQTYSTVIISFIVVFIQDPELRASLAGIVGVEGQKCMNRSKFWMFKLSLNLFNVTQCLRVLLLPLSGENHRNKFHWAPY
jgi:hypothetical protein